MRFFLALVCLASAAHGQSTFGSILGTVHDPSGAAVAGASVALIENDTGIRIDALSDDKGFYDAANLTLGTYTVMASKKGFANSAAVRLGLDARGIVRADLDLGLPTAQESITVHETPGSINTENAVIADSKNGAQIMHLPLNFRALGTNPLQALAVVPGVQVGNLSFRVSLSGGTPSQTEFSMDGITNVGVGASVPILDVYVSPEAIAEFRVSSAGTGAEFGQMGDVSIITRGGTNTLHGSAFWYHQNAALDAKTYDSPAKQAKVFNTFGASLGGPVVLPGLIHGKDRTFFLGAYEGNRLPGSSLQQASVPTADMRAGILDGLPGAPAVDPLSGSPFPGGRVPSSRINSVASALFNSYYPLPNYSSGNTVNNYRILARNDSFTDRYDLRLDHNINGKQRMFVRWSDSQTTQAARFAGPLLPSSDFKTRSNNFVASHSYAMAPNWTNEFRLGITRTQAQEAFPLRGTDVVATLGLQGLDLSHVSDGQGGFPYFDFPDENFTPFGHGRAQANHSRTLQLTDNVTWNKSRHSLKFGADLRPVAYVTT
jgi:hypothetical protein